MNVVEIKPGLTYTGPRWQGDRKVERLAKQDGKAVVHFLDLRTLKRGKSALVTFASNAQGTGMVANISVGLGKFKPLESL